MKKYLAFLLSALLLLNPALFVSCTPGNSGTETETNDRGTDESSVIVSSQNRTLTHDTPTAVFDSGVSVIMSDYLIRDDAVMNIAESAPVEVENGILEGFRLTVYDITLGDRHNFNEFFTIRLPYDANFLEPGQDPELCVTARWHNPDTDEWEAVIYTLDTEKHEIVIRTDHLSEYGCFEISNEGKRKAKVEYVKPWMMYELIDTDTACDILSDYVASNGSDTEKAATLGAKLVNKIQPIAGGVSDFTSQVGALDNILRLGDSEAGLVVKDINIHGKTVEVLGKIGIAASSIKLALEICKGNKTRDDIVSIYKDTVSLMLDIASATETFGSAALSVGLAGVWIFDQILSKMVNTAKSIRMELFGSVYTYYNDTYSGYGHTARTDDDWRDIMIATFDESHGDEKAFSEAMEKKIAEYADKFWIECDKKPDLATELQDDMGITRMPFPMQSEIDKLKKQYINNLNCRINNLIPAVREYYQDKNEAAFEASLLKAQTHFNTVLHVVITDPDKLFTGCIIRFAQLSDTAEAKNWRGRMSPAGTVNTEFTVLGYYLAGCPDHIEVLDKETGNTVIGYGELSGEAPKLTVELKKGELETVPSTGKKMTVPTRVVYSDGSTPSPTDGISARGHIVRAVINQMDNVNYIYDPETTFYSIDWTYVPNGNIINFGSENGLGTTGQFETYYLVSLSVKGQFSFAKLAGDMSMNFVIREESYRADGDTVITTYTFSTDNYYLSREKDINAIYVAFYGPLYEEYAVLNEEGETPTGDSMTRDEHRESFYLAFIPAEPLDD